MHKKRIEFLYKFISYLSLGVYATYNVDDDNKYLVNISNEKRISIFRFYFQITDTEYKFMLDKQKIEFEILNDINTDNIETLKSNLEYLHSKLDFIRRCYIRTYEEVFYQNVHNMRQYLPI